MAVFDPSSPEEAYIMIADAFECSEKLGRPVLFRPTTRICHSYASVAMLGDLPVSKSGIEKKFQKDGGRWVIFPKLAYASHIKIEEELAVLAEKFSSYACNKVSGSGRKGIAAGGVSWSYAAEALCKESAACRLFKVSTVPFPNRLGEEFLRGLDEVLVIEELDPVIERELIFICGQRGINVSVKGKLSGHMPRAGEHTSAGVRKAIMAFLGEGEDAAIQSVRTPQENMPVLPVRLPVLCSGCPHRASFFAVKEASRGHKTVFSGDIGCYTLGNAMPLDMVDTCLCMGAGITMAQGINRAERDTVNFAFIGDSTFFHSGIPGILNAVYNGADIIVAVLDNSTTAMTGGQPHPGTGRTLGGLRARKADILAILSALGVDDLQRVNAFDFPTAKDAVTRAISQKGVRAIIFEGECAALSTRHEKPRFVDESRCVGCGLCVSRLGCPALTMTSPNKRLARIDSASCTGCGLCETVCATNAIEGGGRHDN